jgi:hypothetical protein
MAIAWAAAHLGRNLTCLSDHRITNLDVPELSPLRGRVQREPTSPGTPRLGRDKRNAAGHDLAPCPRHSSLAGTASARQLEPYRSGP